MESTQIIAENIKLQIKKKNITLKKMLEDCSLGVNTVSKMASGTDVTTRTLYKIADYLDVSVDYLLGRTYNPDSHKE